MWYGLAVMSILSTWLNPISLQESAVRNVLFVIDISESMNVRDVNSLHPTMDRLGLSKQIVRDSMAALACGSHVSVGLFTGDEVVVLFEPLEICQHFPAIEQTVTMLDNRMRWIGDSWIIRGLVSGIKEAQKRSLSLVMLTDGDEMPHHSTPRLSDLMPYKGKLKGVLVGVGDETPSPVPRVNGLHEITGYWTPEEAVLEGNHPNLLAYVKELPSGVRADPALMSEVGEHLSARNTGLLKTSASALHFAYINATPDMGPKTLLNLIDPTIQMAERDARWILGLLAAIFALLGWFNPSIGWSLKLKTSKSNLERA